MIFKGAVMNVAMKEILVSVGLLAGVALASHIVVFIWKNVFQKIALKTPTKFDVILFKTTEQPVYFLVLIGGFYLVILKLKRNLQLGEGVASSVLDGAFFTAAVIVACVFVYSIIKSVIDWYLEEIAIKTKTELDDEFLPLLKRLLKIVIIFLGVLVVLSHFNVNINGFLATAGVASLAVALAAQETIANMISGFLIMIDKPFRNGDRIELADGVIGDVFEIGLRSTKILSFENTLIVVPNSEVAKARIVNLSYPDPKVKIRQVVGVAYGTDLVKVKEILTGICKAHKEVLKEPEPAAYFTEFGESSLNLLMVCWVSDYKEKFRINDELNMEIKSQFEREGVEIPFPQRDIHVRNGKISL